MRKKGLQGTVISVTVKDCRGVNAHLVYKPEPDDIYHSEIHGSDTSIILSRSQAKKLAQKAVVEQPIK